MTMIRLNDSGVVFNKENHTYHLEGKELSGITSVIQRQLFPNEYDDVPEEMMRAAAAYGSAVHESCELFDREWVNDGTVEVADYIQLTHTNQLVHEASEYLVTDTKHYASSIDKVYRINQDTFTLADIKTYGIRYHQRRYAIGISESHTNGTSHIITAIYITMDVDGFACIVIATTILVRTDVNGHFTSIVGIILEVGAIVSARHSTPRTPSLPTSRRRR